MAFRYQSIAEAEGAYRAAYPTATSQDIAGLAGMAATITGAAVITAAVAHSIEGQNLSPSAERMAVLMVEAIDREVSPEAWAVVNAHVRAAVAPAVAERVAA